MSIRNDSIHKPNAIGIAWGVGNMNGSGGGPPRPAAASRFNVT
jgi:hypothetical protein